MTIIKVQILNYREYEKEALYLKKKNDLIYEEALDLT
jgi:hypothetical protein